MKKILLISLTALSFISLAQDKKAKDIEAIKSMEGCYKVTFDFAETFSPDTSYEYHENYSSWGIEYVFPVEETENKISLQHILVVNDTFIVKHWRQVWIYENQNILAFQKDRTWKNITIPKDKVKGTWTQKVFQVDDSPRYEGYGTWVHVDGKHYWEGTADAPLPRREFSKRSDYNVTKRHSRIELTDYGWILEQDNEKIIRENGEDELLCWEKGHEKFISGDYDCQPAIDWWEENNQYWNDVREIWAETFENNETIKLKKTVDDKKLFQVLFGAGDKYANEDYNQKKAQKEIREIINSFLAS